MNAKLSFALLASSLMAADFGPPADVQQVRTIVAAKFGHARHASVSHAWALCTAYDEHVNLSVVLHKTGSQWKIFQSGGGAYTAGLLKDMGVPEPDIPFLLKADQ
jgi:hypothetical protein